MNIVILDGYTINAGDLSWDALKPFGSVTVYDRTPTHLILPRIKEAHVVLTSKCLLTREVLESSPHLIYVGILATGINMIDLDYASSRGIAVTNIPAYSTETVAQFTFSLLLAVCNRIETHNTAVHQGMWRRAEDFCFWLTPQLGLAGKTFGIIGFGNIGRRVAEIAAAFGMKVLISTGHPDPSFATNQVSFVSREELYARADVISLHCPLTEENRGSINRETIRKMKDGVILINTARGPLINEQDLADALNSGKVRAAGLDVLSVEPPAESNPLIGLNTCMITPHLAWRTEETRTAIIEIACDNLSSYLAGNSCNLVNQPRSNK